MTANISTLSLRMGFADVPFCEMSSLHFLKVLHQQAQDSNSGPFQLSKWELMDKEHKMGKSIYVFRLVRFQGFFLSNHFQVNARVKRLLSLSTLSIVFTKELIKLKAFFSWENKNDFHAFNTFSAQLDGVSEKAKKRMAEHHSINDWLELSDSFSRAARDKYGKKRVSIICNCIAGTM